MSTDVSRRNVLKSAGIAAGAAVVGGGLVGTAVMPTVEAKKSEFPWPYKKVKTKKVADRGYANYFVAGCMYGVFEAVAGEVADKLGKPYTDFPFAMSSYGGGGIASWGSTCGTCNGAAMAIAMFHTGSLRSQLINEVYAWYENTKLPEYEPKNPVKVDKSFNMAKSKSESVLCHASVSNWVESSKLSGFSVERAERCGRLVADVAAFTVDLLNKAAKGKFVPNNQINSVAEGCLACHSKGHTPGDTLSKMNCTSCHEPH